MAAKVFEKSAEETAFRAVLKEVYESGKNSVAVLWADAALSARFQETLYAFLLKDVLGSAAAGVKLRALCAFCGGEAETAQTEYTHETFIGLMSPITKGENKGTVRLDLFFKKGETHFIPTLFAYVMNNILGDRFKKAVPDSLDRELEGEDSSMALGASLAGEENTEREVLGEMMSADMVQAVYETLHDRPDELFAFAHKQSEGQMDCKTLLKTLRRLRTPEQARAVDAAALTRFLQSPLCARIRAAGERARREYRFSLLESAARFVPEASAGDEILLQGVVDCFFEEDGTLVVVDFKTDRVAPDALAERAEHYPPQLEAYSLALAQVIGKPVKEKILYFLRRGEQIIL